METGGIEAVVVRPITLGEVARLLGVSEGTVRSWERRGWIPLPKRTPAGWRYYDVAAQQALRAFVATYPARMRREKAE